MDIQYASPKLDDFECVFIVFITLTMLFSVLHVKCLSLHDRVTKIPAIRGTWIVVKLEETH